MFIGFLYSFIMYELKNFPSAYFDIARKLGHSIGTNSSIMNGLSITFGFLMMFGGIAFFIAVAIITLPLILILFVVTVASEYVQETIFPEQKFVIDIIAIPILLLITYYFSYTYISFIFIPAFKFGLGAIMSIFSIPSKYNG